jgi:dihydrofolate synthase/folylpolyglutamate synthase
VVEVFERAAKRVGQTLWLGGRDWHASEERGRLVYQDEQGLLDLTPPRLIGRHQFTNAGTAIALLRAAGIAPHPDAISRGVQATEWPARMQRLAHGPLTGFAPAGAELWLDGGHNPGAGEVIAQAMGDLEERVPRPLFIIAGMLNTKDPIGFFKPFGGLARHVFTVPVPDHARGRPPEELAEAARAAGLSAQPMDSVEAALSALSPWRFEAPPRVLICGSLYLAGAMLAANRQYPS